MGLLDSLSELHRQTSLSIHLRFLGHDIPLLPTFSAIFVASRVIKLLNGIRTVNNLPGFRLPLQPLTYPSVFFPTSWWNLGIGANWYWRNGVYDKFGSETISVVPFLYGEPTIHTSNLEVTRQVIAGQGQGPGQVKARHFDKSEAANRTLAKWGMNLVTSLNDVWRKHRRVVGPAFNNDLYELVWTETLNTYRQMEVAEGWEHRNAVVLPVVQKITTKLALLVVARCGFGLSFDWSAPPMGPDGTMSVQESLRVLADSYMLGLMAPDWVRNLPLPGFRQVRMAFNQFSSFMQREIEARTMEVRNEEESADVRKDAFTMLVRANEQETGKFKLDTQEVIGNVFILLFAGHETTAHTLAATLALLALHPEIQSEILEQIVSVVGYDRDPKYEDYSKLDKVLSAFYESLRLFPAAYIMVREATEDTVLDLPNPVGQEGFTQLPVAKGTQIILDMVGIQYNPRYFKDPEEFRPSRWYGVSNESEAFSAFSVGPRACIGRKFATTEGVVFLTLLLRDWFIEPVFHEGESKEAWAKRIFSDPIAGLTLTVKDTPVKLTRRKRE
ncbi:hypothetical protein H0H81_000583 [Sphagnurus paluster]|uniref:Cytochrome P450 n=1 Tax=Sphagnurus paluster TaxID=117069 RepID=A0A9P7K6X3_9AGAR|nr:hypothetical protein H0H81_000583 [Sphagnurus paluster]